MTKSTIAVDHGEKPKKTLRSGAKARSKPKTKSSNKPTKKTITKTAQSKAKSAEKAAPKSRKETKPPSPPQKASNLNLPPRLLKWYDKEHRELPWRANPGQMPNPYHVWLSEIMLQQTVVKTVIPYFEKFTTLWPTLADLAAAELEDIRRAWAGLGYYTRAANLHKCARHIMDEYNGSFPIFAEELVKLPGIGPYTAAAIAAIAFDETATPVDGNIERVMARLFAIEDPLPGVKPLLKQKAASLTPPRRAGDYAQALMDLGATVCTPKNPSCLFCPLSSFCSGYHTGLAGTLPRRQAKKPKPTREGSAFFALREDGMVLLHQREEGGLLGGMMEIPTSSWKELGNDSRAQQISSPQTILDEVSSHDPSRQSATSPTSPPVSGDWWRVPGQVRHTFTHFHLELTVYRSIITNEADLTLFADASRCKWVHRDKLKEEALPSVMRKVIAHALAHT
ncbi:MAG: A/G-specific adenine glycosylase [Rhodomicrobium sp.]|nr:MAG: A/G-specific adenine glycosylase [Rhodomicrobium sp.]